MTFLFALGGRAGEQNKKSARKLAEDAMQDLKAKDRARAGMPGSASDRQQAGAEAEAKQAGFHEGQQEDSHESVSLCCPWCCW